MSARGPAQCSGHSGMRRLSNWPPGRSRPPGAAGPLAPCRGRCRGPAWVAPGPAPGAAAARPSGAARPPGGRGLRAAWASRPGRVQPRPSSLCPRRCPRPRPARRCGLPLSPLACSGRGPRGPAPPAGSPRRPARCGGRLRCACPRSSRPGAVRGAGRAKGRPALGAFAPAPRPRAWGGLSPGVALFPATLRESVHKSVRAGSPARSAAGAVVHGGRRLRHIKPWKPQRVKIRRIPRVICPRGVDKAARL